jgi:transcriptional regulator with XRE-family HTH domain
VTALGTVALVPRKTKEEREYEARVLAHIRQQMEEREWSQNDMAEHLGIKSGTLSAYLRGYRGMKLGFVMRVSKRLGINPTRLLEGEVPEQFWHQPEEEESGAPPLPGASPALAQPQRPRAGGGRKR